MSTRARGILARIVAPGDKAPFADQRARAVTWLRSGGARRLAPFVIFAIALVVRLRFVEDHPPGLYVVADMAFYDRRADHLLAGEASIWDTFTPVGYPALLAIVYRVVGKSHDAIGALQAVLGAGTCVIAAAITARIARSSAAALAVGAALAVYPPLVMYTGFLLTETAFSFLLAGAVWLLVRAMDRGDGEGAKDADGRSFWGLVTSSGLALGAATAMRPNLSIALPLLAACSIVGRAKTQRRRAPVLVVLCAMPVILGVSAYQSRIAGRPMGLASNGGINFFLGVCECHAVRLPGQKISEVSGAHNRRRFTEIVIATEPAYREGHYYGAALSLIRQDPRRILRAMAKIADGFGIGDLGPPPAQPYWPGWNGHDGELRASARWALWLAFVPLGIHALALLATRRLFEEGEEASLAALAMLGSVPLTLALFLGDPRLRVSFDPLAFALAGAAWAALVRRLRGASV